MICEFKNIIKEIKKSKYFKEFDNKRICFYGLNEIKYIDKTDRIRAKKLYMDYIIDFIKMIENK